jgi:hypothetical protein
MARKFLYVNSDGDYQESPGAYEQVDFISTSTGVADAGKPIVLDANGLIDGSMIDEGTIDHGSLDGLSDDDHTQYVLADGSRAFTGNQSMGSNLLTSVLDPVNAQDAATKAYVDLVAQGLKPHANTRVATSGNIDLTSAPTAIDGVTMANGDRVMVWKQTDNTQNGIYVWNGAGSALTRADDFDGDANGEIYNGAYVPENQEGTTYAGYSFVIVSTGTDPNGAHNVGTDPITFDILNSPAQYSGDVGITLDHGSKTIAIDLLDTDSGLTFLGTSTDELAINWASVFTIDSADDLAIKASKIASTATGDGASVVGIEDSANHFTADNVEGALAELASSPPVDSVSFTAGNDITKGDLVYISANNTVQTLDITNANYAIGVAKEGALTGASVSVLKDDTILVGVLSGATAGNKYYWNGTAWTTSIPSTASSYVWRLGCATNSTDAIVEIEFIKRNSA